MGKLCASAVRTEADGTSPHSVVAPRRPVCSSSSDKAQDCASDGDVSGCLLGKYFSVTRVVLDVSWQLPGSLANFHLKVHKLQNYLHKSP